MVDVFGFSGLEMVIFSHAFKLSTILGVNLFFQLIHSMYAASWIVQSASQLGVGTAGQLVFVATILDGFVNKRCESQPHLAHLTQDFSGFVRHRRVL